jgi:hypothetical protein
MAKIDYIQNSFCGGEFGPSLFGRTDIAQYRNACAIVENFLCRPYGSLISTPGTKYIAETKLSALGTNSTVRLIKFVFSRTDAYIIEFGEHYFRFYTNQAVVVTSGTTPYEVAHTYDEDELNDVQFAQINDVICLVHPDHKPAKLTRFASNNWTLTDFAFLGGPFLDDNTTATTISYSDPTAGNPTTLTSSTEIFTLSSGSTRGHVNTYWKIGTTLTSSTTGLDVQGYVKITAVTNTTSAGGLVIKQLSVGPTAEWAEGAWSDIRGWPSCVTFHDGRLFFARTTYEPQKMWGSQPFVYDEFSIEGSYDDDALNLRLASNEGNDIKWLASGSVLVAGTFGGEFTISGGDTGGALTPTTVTAKQQTSWGSESIIPRKIGNFFYYIQRFGKKLRELFYFWDLDTYKSVDKTIFSPHITGDGIIAMDYQQNPETILWCVTTGGTIATLTREVDQEVQAWSRQITDGIFESIAIIPSTDETYDEVWVVVNRTIEGVIHRYIEVFQNMELPDRQDLCFYVHSGLTYSAYDFTSTPTSTTLTLSATAGSINLTASNARFAADDVGQRIRAIDADGVTLGEAEITAYSSSTIVIGTVKKTFTTTTYAAGKWGLSVSEISGLDHLEAETITVLADGGTDKPDMVVSNGTITLSYDYFVVTAGLPYTSTLKTLPIEGGSQRGTAQGKIQKINCVALKVNRSHRGFYIGGADDLLERVSFREAATLMGTPETLYTGIMTNITFNDDYRYGSQIIIENREPLPLEILSLMPTITTEDK